MRTFPGHLPSSFFHISFRILRSWLTSRRTQKSLDLLLSKSMEKCQERRLWRRYSEEQSPKKWHTHSKNWILIQNTASCKQLRLVLQSINVYTEKSLDLHGQLNCICKIKCSCSPAHYCSTKIRNLCSWSIFQSGMIHS